MLTEAEADAILAGAMTKTLAPETWPSTSEGQDLLFARARYHGVSALLAEALAKDGAAPDLQARLKAGQVAQVFWEERHQALLARVLAALRRRGCEAILFKGTALAYGLYPDPWLRPRGDSDILVPEFRFGEAARLLDEEGFQRASEHEVEYVSYQESFVAGGDLVQDHCIDLHRRLSNSELISQLFGFDDLRAAARPLPALGEAALTVSPVHALEIACIHRGVHQHVPYFVDGQAQHDGDRLIWLYDIHLLASSFGRADWEALVAEAGAKGTREICGAGLGRAQALFGTEVPDHVHGALAGSGESVSRYLRSGLIGRTWFDFWALPDWRKRRRLLREILLPPAAYMRGKYEGAILTWLPWLYMRRSVEGVVRRLLPR